MNSAEILSWKQKEMTFLRIVSSWYEFLQFFNHGLVAKLVLFLHYFIRIPTFIRMKEEIIKIVIGESVYFLLFSRGPTVLRKDGRGPGTTWSGFGVGRARSGLNPNPVPTRPTTIFSYYIRVFNNRVEKVPVIEPFQLAEIGRPQQSHPNLRQTHLLREFFGS